MAEGRTVVSRGSAGLPAWQRWIAVTSPVAGRNLGVAKERCWNGTVPAPMTRGGKTA